MILIFIADNKTCQNVEYGTGVGMADAVPLMQMAIDILPKLNYEIKPGEGLALLSSNALSMSEASIVCSKLKKVLDLAEFGNALAILAENGNNSIIEEPGLNAAKHWKQKTQIITRMQAKSLWNRISHFKKTLLKLLSGSYHLDWTLNVEIDIERQISVIVIFLTAAEVYILGHTQAIIRVH